MSISDPSKSHYGGSGALIKKYVIKSKSIFKYLVQIGQCAFAANQCDHMANFFVQYLAIYKSGKIWADIIENLPKHVQNFAKC